MRLSAAAHQLLLHAVGWARLPNAASQAQLRTASDTAIQKMHAAATPATPAGRPIRLPECHQHPEAHLNDSPQDHGTCVCEVTCSQI